VASSQLREAQRFVEQRYGARARRLIALPGGEWSKAFAFELDGDEVVVRFGAYEADYEKERFMAAQSSPRLPIPAVLETGETASGYFAVSERCHGRFLDDLDGPSMSTVLPAVLAALDAMREIDLAGTTGYGGWGADGTAPYETWAEALLETLTDDSPGRRIHGWRAALDASPTGAGPFDRGLSALGELAQDLQVERHVIHNDLLYRNVLVEGERLVGVFDWANSMYGDHLYDAAWLLYWWPWYPGWREIDIRGALETHWAEQGLDTSGYDERLCVCQLHIGLDHQAYTAFTGRFDDLERTAEQTLALLR
jgi:hygromycin-B 4-O-kinase